MRKVLLDNVHVLNVKPNERTDRVSFVVWRVSEIDVPALKIIKLDFQLLWAESQMQTRILII